MKKLLPILVVGILVFGGLGAVGMPSNKTIVNTNENDVATSGEIVSRDWSIVATYSIPESAAGLAYDGAYLYCGIYGANGDEVYQIDPDTGSYSLLFSGPQEDAFGLTYDGVYLWTTDHPGSSSTPAVAMQLDMNGNLFSQFDLPDHYMSGIAYDDGDFWVATYYPDPATIHKVDDTGSILQQFTAPDDQPWDLCLENDNLWMADYWGDTLYKIDPSTGNLLESHSSEGVDPAGIVWDGAYLWYCDNGIDYTDDYLYKIDLAGAGTPDLDCSGDLHWIDVQPGATVTEEITVENIGEPLSMLDWEITEYPDWGTWTFVPDSGEDLTPEDGEVIIGVSVVAPNEQETEVTGEIKIINSENSSDFCIIDVSLATPVSQQVINPLLQMILERFPNAFPILRHLMGL